MEGWNAFKADLAEQAECEETLRGELALIENAEEEERKALAAYEATLARLEREMAEAKRDLQDVKAVFSEFEASRREYSERYEDIEYLAPDASNVLKKKLELMRAKDSLQRESGEIKKKLTPPVWACVVAVVLFALLGWGISGLVLEIPWGMMLGASGGGLGVWIPVVFAASCGCLGWLLWRLYGH